MNQARNLFDFGLWPLAEVETPSMGWFGLTDGWYTMVCGHADLMRYNQALVEATPEWKWRGPYPDYQVARLHTDLLVRLPLFLEPIPSDVWETIATPESFDRFVEQCTARGDPTDVDHDAAWNLVGLQEDWVFQRHLDNGYFAGQPDINIFNHDDQITIRWRNRGTVEQTTGLPWNAVEDGEFTLPVSNFTDEVRRFHDRLIHAMQQRLGEINRHWPFPELECRLSEYRASHAEESDALKRAFARRQTTPWDDVRNAVARMR